MAVLKGGMNKLSINQNNRKWYSEDFIKGFECGIERQFEKNKAEIQEGFDREIEYANKDIDFAEGTDESEENYMRGYLGGLLCAYRLVFGKSYEESEKSEEE